MKTSQIPEAVQEFIRVNINSVEQLEILLLLRRYSDRSWTASEVSKELLTLESSAAIRLTTLEACGLVDARVDGDASYFRYNVIDPDKDFTIQSLENVYRERKDAVIALIFSPRREREVLNSFVQAFVLRKSW